MSESYPYYYRTGFVIFMLILFFPAGLVLMWKGNKFGKRSRIIISAIGLSLLYPPVAMKKKQLFSLKGAAIGDRVKESIKKKEEAISKQ